MRKMSSPMKRRRLNHVRILERSCGLPKSRTITDHKQDPVFTLSDYNYKIQAFIGLSEDSKMETLFVLDTGEEKNLFFVDHLPDETLLSLQKNKLVVKRTSARSHQLTVLGICTTASYFVIQCLRQRDCIRQNRNVPRMGWQVWA